MVPPCLKPDNRWLPLHWAVTGSPGPIYYAFRSSAGGSWAVHDANTCKEFSARDSFLCCIDLHLLPYHCLFLCFFDYIINHFSCQARITLGHNYSAELQPQKFSVFNDKTKMERLLRYSLIQNGMKYHIIHSILLFDQYFPAMGDAISLSFNIVPSSC